MLTILDVLTKKDALTDEDFWRQQDFVEVPDVTRPESFLTIINEAKKSFKGKRVAVPKMYVGGQDSRAKPTAVSQD